MICIVTGVAPATRILNHHRLLLRRTPERLVSLRRATGTYATAMKAAVAGPHPVILTSGASGRVNVLFSFQAIRNLLLLLLQGFLLLLLLQFRRGTIIVFASTVGDGKQEAGGSGSPRKSGGSGAVAVLVQAGTVLRRTRDEAAARRGMAIRRLRVDVDGGSEGRSGREFAVFTTARGDKLFTQSWTPLSMQTRGLVVLMHGLNEHSGRYNYFSKELNENGFKVYAMDWIGHGGSDWLHGYVHSLDYAVNDMKAFLEKVLTENPGLPCFCFGHSTGAAIVLKAILDPKIETCIEGVVLISPAIRVQPSHPFITVVAPIFSLFLPKYQFGAVNKGPPVSRDPEALRAKYSDPLVFTGSIRVRTGYEILRITSYLQQNLSKVSIPFIVMHGTADTITDPKASQRLYDAACSSVKSIKLYEGFLHDLLFEPERDEITKDIIDWLNSRLDAL